MYKRQLQGTEGDAVADGVESGHDADEAVETEGQSGMGRCSICLLYTSSHKTSASGYVSNRATYTAQNCEGCPLRCLCFDASGDRRVKMCIRDSG